MKILAMEKELPSATEEKFKPHSKSEAVRVWELYQADVFREMYFRGDYPSAVLILECETIEDALRVIDTLPLVKEGLIAFDLIPLIPYPGFGRLFADKNCE